MSFTLLQNNTNSKYFEYISGQSCGQENDMRFSYHTVSETAHFVFALNWCMSTDFHNCARRTYTVQQICKKDGV